MDTKQAKNDDAGRKALDLEDFVIPDRREPNGPCGHIIHNEDGTVEITSADDDGNSTTLLAAR